MGCEEKEHIGAVYYFNAQVEKSVAKAERKRSMTQTKADWVARKRREVGAY